MYRTQDTWVAGKLIQSMYQKNQTKKTINKIKHYKEVYVLFRIKNYTYSLKGGKKRR